MHLILHGDNHLASRQALHQLVKAEPGRAVVRLDGTTISPIDLHQALTPKNLFGQDKIIVIESAFAQKSLIPILANAGPDATVVIWEPKALTAHQLKQLPQFKPQLFKIPAVIFSFLDKLDIPSFHQALKTETAEHIFYMLHRRISQLIQAQDAPQTLKLADWQKSRLVNQAKRFSLDQLVTLHSQLLNLDIGVKTGAALVDLTTSLELLLLDL